MIVVTVPAGLCKIVSELAVADRFRRETQIRACLIECDRIEGGEHTDVRKNRSVIFRVTVAVRRDVRDQADVEAGSAVTDCLGVFGDPPVQELVRIPAVVFDRVEGTCTDAASAALAEFRIDEGFPGVIGDCVGSALPGTSSAASS